jgi:hypothetical protein
MKKAVENSAPISQEMPVVETATREFANSALEK